MRLTYLLLAVIALPIYADTVTFRNDREASSYFSGNTTNKLINNALREVNGSEIKRIYHQSLSTFDESSICSYDLNNSMIRSLQTLRPGFREFKGAIHYLRSQNELDDVAVKIILEAYETITTKLNLPKDSERLNLPKDPKVTADSIALIASFPTRFQKRTCFDDAYRSLSNEMEKLDKYMTDNQMEALLVAAYSQKKIDATTYALLEKGRVNQLDNKWLTLKNYSQKIRSLRTNKPLRDPNEKSEFVTESFGKKSSVSRRMRLMENYNDFQIMIMAEVVKKLRMRLDADRAEILIFRRDVLQDTVVLEPMERFRMALKMLRKEMSLLGLNHYFNGRTPDYMDLMTASYEVSIIAGTELTEIAGLEDIWNPKRTFWEKSQTWIRSIGSVGTMLLPPPFGFIPSLALVVIEMTTKKTNNNQNDPTSLF